MYISRHATLNNILIIIQKAVNNLPDYIVQLLSIE
jgi:hypothetical protein